MSSQFAILTFFIALVSYANFSGATTTSVDLLVDDENEISFMSPLPPEYEIKTDNSVSLRVCYNWSCTNKQTMNFTSDDIALVKKSMGSCPDTTLHDRLQRVRIGIWQMELLAQKYQPLLVNDLAINDFEEGVEGRMDCIDNSSNTTTYLHILQDIGELSGWTISSPHLRHLFFFMSVHWTAVIVDTDSSLSWSVDSWYRPNGHLPLVMPLEDWIDHKRAWQPPFKQVNAAPKTIDALCKIQ